MRFNIIVATDQNGGIGRFDGSKHYIPWENSIDMKFFKDTTSITNSSEKSNAVVMGRNTYFSLPKNKFLKNRINIVISSKPNLIQNDKVNVFDSFEKSLEYCKKLKNLEKIFVIGGRQLYEEALEHQLLNQIYWNVITEDNTTEESNIFFPISLKMAYKRFRYDTNYDLNQLSSIKGGVIFNKFTTNITNTDEQKYLDLLQNILNNGDTRQTRNSITKSVFGKSLEFNLRETFPLLTTKKMFLRGIFEELVWFLKGQTDSKILEQKKVNIWKLNSKKEFIEKVGLPYREGDIGNMYGFQWRHAGVKYIGCDENYSNEGFDQIKYCLDLLKNDKYSRRIIMSTYSPSDSNLGVLYPCHGIVVQWYVKEEDGINYLSCHMYQRSADMFLGVPFNISSYSLLTYMMCQILNNDNTNTGLKFKPDRLIISFGDLHIYENHFNQVKEQLGRKPFLFPKIILNKEKNNFGDFVWEDIKIINYNHYSSIKASMVA